MVVVVVVEVVVGLVVSCSELYQLERRDYAVIRVGLALPWSFFCWAR